VGGKTTWASRLGHKLGEVSRGEAVSKEGLYDGIARHLESDGTRVHDLQDGLTVSGDRWLLYMC
jgi:hypothetical protein